MMDSGAGRSVAVGKEGRLGRDCSALRSAGESLCMAVVLAPLAGGMLSFIRLALFRAAGGAGDVAVVGVELPLMAVGGRVRFIFV